MTVFESINEIKVENMIAWCKENNQVAWLKEEVKKTEKAHKLVKSINAEGEVVKEKVEVEVPISFISMRSDFVKKFMPEILKSNQEKKPNFRDIIGAL